jgi:hypothetical protein
LAIKEKPQLKESGSRQLDPEIESELRRTFGARGFNYVPEDAPPETPPVWIEVKPFRVMQFIEISDAIVDLALAFFVRKERIETIIGRSGKEVIRILGPYVSVPSSPLLTLDVLPFDVIPDCLRLFMKSFSPGKWQALGQEIVERFHLQALVVELKKQAEDVPTQLAQRESSLE